MPGGSLSRELHDNDPEYILEDGTIAMDDQTGVRLKPELMAKARKEEIQHFKGMGVYEKVELQEFGRRLASRPSQRDGWTSIKVMKPAQITGACWWRKSSEQM